MGVINRFTEGGREALVLAEAQARDLRFSHVGTEMLLLGVLRADGIAADVLKSFGVTLELARTRVGQYVSSGEELAGSEAVPVTPRARSVLGSAFRESLRRGEFQVGPEHILLGIARVNEGVAIRVLRDLEVDAEKLHNGVIRTFPAPRPVPGPNVEMQEGQPEGSTES
ncbi:hypothetical protein AYO39_02390 [Actinobacteria bacterium SCGC AG-212-D09]|nr:hypothetical protein AYO39_02390 [Actinobacteria bacterium SCGC AG-212-D09]